MAASERIMPEPLAFSINVVRHATGITATSEPGNFGALPTWSSDTATTGQPATPLLCLREGHQSEQHWSSLLSAAMGVIERSSELFLEAESFPEMFTAALDLLQQLDSQQLPKVSQILDIWLDEDNLSPRDLHGISAVSCFVISTLLLCRVWTCSGDNFTLW